MLFSVVVPVYNRPAEVRELLESLTAQEYTDFEVIIVEDGSDLPCREVVDFFRDRLRIRYFSKENSGQGYSRNYGFERAQGEYLVVFDSDCIIPAHYFSAVRNYLSKHPVDAWGGPDRAHPGFSTLQKAINYAMTSFFTTGGIRGGEVRAATYHPRSFNMGISRKVWERTGGYRITRMGEDIEFSIRISRMGFKIALIPEAYVYHKRRTDLCRFFKQLHFFGRARINIGRYYPEEVKWIHRLPALFLLITLALLILILREPGTYWPLLIPYFLFALLLFFHSFWLEKNLSVALKSVLAGFTLLLAYGSGYIRERIGEMAGKQRSAPL